MSLNSFSSGINTSFSSELNNNFKGSKYITIYTGADLNRTTDGTSTYAIAIAGSDLTEVDYLEIEINGSWKARGGSGGTGSAVLDVEDLTSSTDILASHNVVVGYNATGSAADNSSVEFMKLFHAITTDNRNNGMNVQFSVTLNEQFGTFSFTNRAIVIKGVHSS